MQALLDRYGVLSITATIGNIILATRMNEPMEINSDSDLIEINSEDNSFSFPANISYEYNKEEHLIVLCEENAKFELQLGYTENN